MNNMKLTLGIEPTDKYEKAKMGLIQARKSFFRVDTAGATDVG